MKTKICSDCKQEKPATKEYFHGCKGKKYDLHNLCKLCRKIRSKAQRRKQVAKIYGMTEDDYYELLDFQGNKCAICGQQETNKSNVGGKRHMSIDHNHETGVVRGILCSKCNSMLGYARDNPEILRKGADFVEAEP